MSVVLFNNYEFIYTFGGNWYGESIDKEPSKKSTMGVSYGSRVSIVGVKRCQSTAENLSTVRLSGGSRFVNIVGDCSVKISSSVK